MSFLRTLERLAGGRVLQDCEEGLAELVEAVKNTQGEGSVTLKIKVGLNEADGEVVSVEVNGDVSVKIPRQKRGGLVCFVRDDGLLSARDPRQPALPGMPAEEEKPILGLAVPPKAAGATA